MCVCVLDARIATNEQNGAIVISHHSSSEVTVRFIHKFHPIVAKNQTDVLRKNVEMLATSHFIYSVYALKNQWVELAVILNKSIKRWTHRHPTHRLSASNQLHCVESFPKHLSERAMNRDDANTLKRNNQLHLPHLFSFEFEFPFVWSTYSTCSVGPLDDTLVSFGTWTLNMSTRWRRPRLCWSSAFAWRKNC